MEIKQFIRLFRQWYWAVLLGLAAGAVCGFFVSGLMTPTYEGKTKILVTSITDSNSELAYLSDQQLVQTYVEFLSLTPLQQSAAERLDVTIDPKKVFIQQIKDTQIIQVTVEDSDPERAANIANTLFAVLVDQTEELESSRYLETEASLRQSIENIESQMAIIRDQLDTNTEETYENQIAFVNGQVTSLKTEIETLQAENAALNSTVTLYRPLSAENQIIVAANQARIDQLTPMLSFYQQLYANLLLVEQPVSGEQLTVNPQLTRLQSALDNYQQIYFTQLNSLESLQTERLKNIPNLLQIEVAAVPEKPVRPLPLVYTILAAIVGAMAAVGIIIIAEMLNDTLKTPTDIAQHLDLPVLGFIPQVHINISDFTDRGLDENKKRYLPLIEAFHCLRLNVDSISKHKRKSSLLIVSPGIGEGKSTVARNLAASYSQSGKKTALVQANYQLDSTTHYLGFDDHEEPNMVVIDGHPMFMAASREQAARVDYVLLVIRPWHTTRDNARSAVEQLNQVGAHVLGVVINRIPPSRSYFYDGYQRKMRYFSQYQNPAPEPAFRGSLAAEKPRNGGEPEAVQTRAIPSEPAIDLSEVPPESLLGRLQNLRELRTSRNQVYPLWSMLGMLILGGIMEEGDGSLKWFWQQGTDHWNQIAPGLGFSYEYQPPSYSTIRYIISKFDTRAFAKMAQTWQEGWEPAELDSFIDDYRRKNYHNRVNETDSTIEIIHTLSGYLRDLVLLQNAGSRELLPRALELMKTAPVPMTAAAEETM